MDYGKLAYLKAEELEETIRALIKKERAINRQFTATPLRNLQKGEYSFPTVYTQGSMSVIVTALVTANSACEAELTLCSNGVKVGGKRVVLSEKEEREVVFTFAVESSGEITLTLSSEEPITLNSVSLLVSGYGADISLSPVRSAMDKYDYYWCIVECNDGIITAKNYYEEERTSYKTVTIGEGICCDVCADESGFAVTHTDILGNTFVTFLDLNMNKKLLMTVCDGATSSIIGRAEKGCVLGLVINGKLYFRMVTREGISQKILVEEVERVDEATFVKNSALPAVIIRTDGKSRLMRALHESGNEENATFVLSVTTEVI